MWINISITYVTLFGVTFLTNLNNVNKFNNDIQIDNYSALYRFLYCCFIKVVGYKRGENILKKIVTFLTLLVTLLFTTNVMAKTKVNQHSTRGEASYYAGFHHGKKTASGERFNMHSLTAAHRTLPLGSKIKVTNLNNGKEVVVRVNDRGPYARGRVIDVSLGAAKKLDMIKTGTAKVSIQILHVGNNKYVSA